MKTLFVCQKKSGNYTIATHVESAWTLIKECNSPKELKECINSLPAFSQVIKAEYSQSQLKSYCSAYDIKDSLRAFGLSVSKSNIENFNNL
jgi:hypothetical protein